MNINQCCQTCKYGQIKERRNTGEIKLTCHRFPPLANGYSRDALAYFPVVWDNAWCGEWRSKLYD